MSSSSKDHINPADQNSPKNLGTRARLLIRNTLATASSSIFGQLLALITFPILVRQVGPVDYGIFALASSAVGYFAVVNLAARASVMKYTAELSENDQNSISAFFSNAVFINSLLGILIAAVLVFLALFCQQIFTISAADVSRAKQILFINAAAVFLSQPLSVFGSLLYGFQKYGLISALDALWGLVRSAVIVAMYYFDGSIFWLVWEEVLFQLVKFTTLALVVRKRYPFISIDFNCLNSDAMKKIFSYGGWSVIYMVAFIMVYQGSIILTGIFMSIAAIVYLQIAYKLYNLVNTVAQFLNAAVVPSSSAAIAAGDERHLRGLLISGAKINLSIMLPLTINILVFAPEIIRFWVGPEYVQPAVNVSRVMIASWLILAPTALLTQVYFGQKDIWRLALSALLAACAQSVMAIILCRYFDLFGVALACSVFYIFMGIIGFTLTSKKFNLSWSSFFSRVVYANYATSLIYAALLGMFLYFLGLPENLIKLLVYFAIAGITGISLNLFLNTRHESLIVTGQLKNDLSIVFARTKKKIKGSDPSIP